MMRQEKQIEGIEEVVTDKEEGTIKNKLNRNRDNDKRKKIILYVVIGVLVAILVGLLVYILIGNNSDTENNEIGNENEVVNGEVDKVEEDNSNLGYVSCDDNTALLNVRNSTTGSIVDGLSCYKEVTIEEELAGTDACDNWYKVSYNKNNSNYTGYACGTYIKKLDIDKKVIKDTKKLIDKALLYYKGNMLGVYCGETTGTKTIEFEGDMTGNYVKSEYKNIEELKNYVLSFLDEDLISIKLELSDIDNLKYYDNYYEIDGSLYCRNYVGTGVDSYYTGNYDIEIISYSDNKTIVNIAYQYISDASDCELEEISNCSRNDFVYDIGKITIDSGVITKMDFYK